MKTKAGFAVLLVAAIALPVATLMFAAQAARGAKGAPPRPQGPCDVYAAAGAPCVGAHSSTRALYASYNGPLYQVMRQSDGKTLDIGVVQPSANDAGGYADAAAQDAFCANTYCWITTLYDQSGQGNDLTQAPRGGFSGPAMGGFNNLPIADMAPVTVMGHKVYGVFIAPGMGLRNNNPKGTAVDDQAEGQYWVIDGHHFNSGCCFDYGNAETDSRDDGNGTMETTYYGTANVWYHGHPPGPWIMTDQENNLVGCVNPDGSKLCVGLPSIDWRFVTAIAKGEPHHWTSLGGDAQRGELAVMFDGPRINATYDPMRKQGAILLGNGGDNSVGSQGTFYEGAMTAAGTFPSDATDQLVQANVVVAGYNLPPLTIAPASATPRPPGLQTFTPRSSQETVVTFTNTGTAPATDVRLSLDVPSGWTAAFTGGKGAAATIAGPVGPGASVSATFKVTSPRAAFNGDLVARAAWTDSATGTAKSDARAEKVRNVSPVKLNEFRISTGSPFNPTDSFIELYNPGDDAIDVSNWTLTHHPAEEPIFSSVQIPAGTKLAPKAFYLLGLANSGLAVPARKGDTTLYVRSTDGMKVGDTIEIDTGSGREARKIAQLGTAASAATTLWQPLPEGPVITIPAGSTNVPVTHLSGFAVGEKIALGYGTTTPAVANNVERYEVVTVTAVGKPGTQAWLSMDAKAGDTNIKVSSVENISVGDQIRLDIDTMGHGIETVTVTRVGTASVRNTFRGPLNADEDPGTGLDLAAPLKFDHASNMPFSVRGTGISFEPATAFAHASNEPVQALGTGITLDQPLARDHAINAAVRDAQVTTAGYQGQQAPDQWFGGPALFAAEQTRPGRTVFAGAMILRDGAGLVVDSLNYGLIVDPWAAEGYQAGGGPAESGSVTPTPTRFRPMWVPAGADDPSNRSVGRFPDGVDTDSNRADFLIQPATSLASGSAAGTANIKVESVREFSRGQTITIDVGPNQEAAVISTVGTSGGTAMGSASTFGATELVVGDISGFSTGQTIAIDRGANFETAIVASTNRGFPVGFRGGPGRPATITVTTPLRFAHAAEAAVAGTGITLTTALTRAHASGVPIGSDLPTPGAPNRYYRDLK
ncbi:arabinofuranosidase catalytic domain-containing protein [Opitutus terrae]|uniref:Xylan 1,4-beta-xylosidase n=1 Tax=Opitutus terrae (strain DSM 11246 / JCM 15787 / PB90-1) TaxID=452637 RepID=B1ZPT8_OPITP|nr:arabinofuranosidase catalytic domain-containing protein [Opitutus terrae]ACB75541.1 Xylan 1,4-beta-xylosidase [Opitutus terrae PB90-1]